MPSGWLFRTCKNTEVGNCENDLFGFFAVYPHDESAEDTMRVLRPKPFRQFS